jgi:hypothetical protein
MTTSPFDLNRHKWREVTGEPGLSYLVHHDYTILGYDRGAGTLDMLVRWGTDGGHCPIHRHISTTTVLVLEGEQHLWDLYPDRVRGEHRIRRAGEYALSVGDQQPHLERGGDSGGIAFFSNHSEDGRLYDVLDEDLKVVFEVTMDVLLEDFESNT